jgi:hypothetical protein
VAHVPETMTKINKFEAIVPNQSLGGLHLRTSLFDIQGVVRGLGITQQGSYKMISPFEARYLFGDGSIQASVDIRNGRIFKLTASNTYQGKFGAIHVGMLARNAMIADSRLYYDEAEEYILCRGISGINLSIPIDDPNPSEVEALPISSISVYAIEIMTMEGQNGHWYKD